MDKFIKGLFKFTAKQHAESMVTKGEILFRRMSYFKEVEDKQRRDDFEGLDHIIQPQNAEITLSYTDDKGQEHSHTINSEDLASAVEMRNRQDVLIACFYACNETNIACDEIFSSRARDFGNTCAAISDVSTFINRLNIWCQHQQIGFKAKRVEYKDLSIYSGPVGPFVKDTKFKEEHEYRFVMELNETQISCLRKLAPQIPNDKTGLIIQIGTLDDIAQTVPSASINSLTQIIHIPPK